MCAFSIKTITFNPGPSQLTPKIVEAIQDISQTGFLSQSHRGTVFMDISKQAIEGLRQKMRLPSGYYIFYQSSATTAMDTLLRNLVFRKSFHFVHGAFATLFFKVAQGIGLEASAHESPWDEPVRWEDAQIPADVELIAVTHNETSSGLMWPSAEITKLRQRYPTHLLAVDVTSSFGAMMMEWGNADIWFGSVQKCLGLPAGLGFLIVSPRAFEKAKIVIEKKGGVAAWQRFDSMAEKMHNYQTPETPNMLDIALLARQMADWDIDSIERELQAKAQMLYEEDLPWTPYVKYAGWRSPTVANFIVENPEAWQAKAKRGNMILGKGYGPLKQSCIRIANFPAISKDDLRRLLEVLKGA